MEKYKGTVLEWNWLHSYGIVKISATPDNNKHMIGNEVFLTQAFKSRETKNKIDNILKSDEKKEKYDVTFLDRSKIWFERGERILFKLTAEGLATEIEKIELD
tara:strand:+ start:459 stop:767 length:309 start_codon:yes stop_codon:yes gene_type:complete